jgi:hypothetical protein
MMAHHIAERMAARAARCSPSGITRSVAIDIVESVMPEGAQLLAAEDECVLCGFGAVGRETSEAVVEEAVEGICRPSALLCRAGRPSRDQIPTALASQRLRSSPEREPAS